MKQRIVTGALAGVVFLALLTAGGLWFSLLIALMAVIGLSEFIRMNDSKKLGWPAWIGYLAILILVWPPASFLNGSTIKPESLIWIVMFIIMTITVVTKNKVDIKRASQLFLGVVYIGMGFKYMIITRQMDDGLFWTLLLFACIWVTDSGAYFTGKAIGKTPLWPAISPNKTIEGSIGGAVLAILTALIFAWCAPDLLDWKTAVGIGLIAAIAGQLGDLIQSAYKRACGVKDSGTILPGHGGILDRCDSWLIVFPLVHICMLLG